MFLQSLNLPAVNKKSSCLIAWQLIWCAIAQSSITYQVVFLLVRVVFSLLLSHLQRNTYTRLKAGVCSGLQSIRRAHANVKPGKLRVNTGELLEANANRSPSAYLHNPEEERARYQHNTDKIMTQLSVSDSEGKGDQSVVPHVLVEGFTCIPCTISSKHTTQARQCNLLINSCKTVLLMPKKKSACATAHVVHDPFSQCITDAAEHSL